MVVGLSQGSQPIIGFNYGARKYKRVKQTLLTVWGLAIAAGTIAEMLFQFFPDFFIGLFGGGEDLYIDFAVKFLRVYLCAIPIVGIQITSSNYFSATGYPVKGVLLSISRQIFLYLPLIYFLPKYLGMDGILISQPIADLVSVLLSLAMVRASFRAMSRLENRDYDNSDQPDQPDEPDEPDPGTPNRNIPVYEME